MAEVVSLREHVEALREADNLRFKSEREDDNLRNQQRFDAMETAIKKAETATERRFESVNEFRSTLTDQTKEFPTKAVVDGKFAALEAQVAALTGRLDRREGSGQGLHSGWLILVAAIGSLSSIAAIIAVAVKLGS
jgi:hypothetical protein